MDDSTREDYLWLMSEAASRPLQYAMESFRLQKNVVRLARLLRQDLSRTRAAIVMEQAQLRLRAGKKFPLANEMFFTRRGLEQSSSWNIARYKADQFTDCYHVADICCGIGGDLIALHGRNVDASFQTIGVDADELTARFAKHNLAVCGSDCPSNSDVLFQTFESTTLDEFDGIHTDPDRRGRAADFERTVHGSRFEPSLQSLFARRSNADLIAIKVAPATPRAKDWPDAIEREWIGDRRECKQQVIWSGEKSARPGQRTATCVDRSGVATRFSVPDSKVGSHLPVAESIGDCIYEPHPAVLAAELGHALGCQLNLHPLASDVAYLTGQLVSSPLLQSFRVLEVLPLHLKKAFAALKAMDVGGLEVKRRGVEQVAGDQFMKLKLKGSRCVTVILTRLGKTRMAIVTERIEGYLNDFS